MTGDGTGLSGLRVRFAADSEAVRGRKPVRPRLLCVDGARRRVRQARVDRAERPPAAALGRSPSLCLRAGRFPPHPRCSAPSASFRSLRSAVYRERLSTGAGKATTTLWRHEAPDRLSYDSDNGNAGVVIGRTRWDLVVGGGWKRSLQHPPLAMPAVPWGAGAYDVNLLGGGRIDGRAVVRLSLFEPSTPAWYTVTLDRATLRPVIVDMTATAHFMRDRYLAFDVPRQIRPPVKD